MSLAEMQSCLARLYTDFTFQRLFFLDPSFILEEYQLSQGELQALTGLNRTQLNRFAVSLMHKSQEKFEIGFPLLFKAAATQIEDSYPRFYHLFRSHSQEPQFLEFAGFMEQTLKADPELPPYLNELARYERQLITAELKGDYQRSLSRQSLPVLSLEACPVLAPGVTHEEYRYNIVSVAQALRQDQKIDRDITGSFIFLVYLSPGKAHPQILQLNSTTRNLIEFCNGRLAVGEIIGKIEQALGQADLQAVVIQKLDKLVKLGVVDV